MKRIVAFACGLICCLIVLSLPASADPIYPVYGTAIQANDGNSRIEGATEIVTGGDWLVDTPKQSISWLITGGPGAWHYEYTFSYFDSPGISHVILDLTDDCVPGNPNCVTQVAYISEEGISLAFQTFGLAPGNPGFPAGAEIIGVKFDRTTDNSSIFTISFDSSRAPVYGDIYLKGGDDSFAYNYGITNHSYDNVLGFIARPNGDIPLVPEPATMLMLGLGLASLGLIARRKKS